MAGAVPSTPTLVDKVLDVLLQSRGMPVHVDDIARRVYDGALPKHYRSSVRCAVQRIRERERERLTIPTPQFDGCYRVIAGPLRQRHPQPNQDHGGARADVA